MADDREKKDTNTDTAQDTEKEKDDDFDVILMHSRTADGAGIRALRSRPGVLESAELRSVKEGQPLGKGEIVKLLPRQESPLLWNVETIYRGEEERPSSSRHAGPPRISSSKYRNNWEAVFGTRKRARKEELN